MKKTLGVGYLKGVAARNCYSHFNSVTTGYSYVNRGGKLFIDEVENGGNRRPPSSQ